jgi:ribose-phosphate pyrophosphokinase
MKPILFKGTSSEVLAQKIALLNNFEVGNMEVVQFENSELKVTLKSDVVGREVILVQSTSNPTNENLIELLFTLDALKREGASRVTVIIPYFGYARQDMQHRKGECVSAHVVVKIIESLGASKVITVDIHDESIGGIFSIPFRNLSVLPIMAKAVYKDLQIKEEFEKDYLVGSPDQGGIERAKNFAEHFYMKSGVNETVVIEKKRNLDKLHQSKSVELYGDVANKTVILVDDIATSAKTIINAANMCLNNGAVGVYAAVVHPDFAQGVMANVEQSSIIKFYTTNTIEKTVDKLFNYSKFAIVDVTEVFKL